MKLDLFGSKCNSKSTVEQNYSKNCTIPRNTNNTEQSQQTSVTAC